MPIQLTRKLRITLIVLAALLVSYAAFGFWLVPRIVRSQIADFSEQHWQRKPALGDISFNPFTFALEIHAFAFKDSRDEPLMSFDRLLVNLDIASLWRRGISFHEIELDNPSSHVVVRNDGSLNLNELSAPFAAPPGAAAPPADEEPARLFIDRFQLRSGAVEFEDRARTSPFKARLTPVNFELLDFSTVGGSGNRYSLQATSTAGERFRWSGAFGLAPLKSQGQFELAEVQARTLWSYLQESLGFEVSDGLVGVQGSYDFAATDPDLTLRVNLASVDVGNLRIRPRGGDTDWISLGKIAIVDTKVDLGKRVLDVASVRLSEGVVIANRATDGRVNLLTLLAPPATTPTDAPAPATPPASAQPTTIPAWTVNVPELALSHPSLASSLLGQFGSKNSVAPQIMKNGNMPIANSCAVSK
jgi:hypothetical protein